MSLDHISIFNALTANELIKLSKVKDVIISLKLTFTPKRIINVKVTVQVVYLLLFCCPGCCQLQPKK